MDIDLAELRAFAVDAALAAGRLTLEYFRGNVQVETKADASPVTIADRKAEELIRARIEKHYPGHGIVGEEFGVTEGREPGRWILDPIDGTFSFICGVPLYSNLIGFEWRGRMVLGVINVPGVGEIVHAAEGLGCRCNDRPARASETSDLSKARLATTTVKLHEREGTYAAYARLRQAVAQDRGWPDAYGYMLVATGRCDVMVDPIMSLWDIAPLYSVLTEAGGRLTDWSGRDSHTATRCVASNGRLHQAAVDLLSR